MKLEDISLRAHNSRGSRKIDFCTDNSQDGKFDLYLLTVAGEATAKSCTSKTM